MRCGSVGTVPSGFTGRVPPEGSPAVFVFVRHCDRFEMIMQFAANKKFGVIRGDYGIQDSRNNRTGGPSCQKRITDGRKGVEKRTQQQFRRFRFTFTRGGKWSMIKPILSLIHILILIKGEENKMNT